MRRTYNYWVETKGIDGWQRLMGACGNRSYALGWLHGIQSYYPSPAARVVRSHAGGSLTEVVEQRAAKGPPRPGGIETRGDDTI